MKTIGDRIKAKRKELMDTLYGVDPDTTTSEPGSNPTLPAPATIIAMFAA